MVRSPWAGGGCRCAGPGSVPPMARTSCRCPAMSCSPPPRSSAGWPWSACWPSCPPAATGPAWSRSDEAVEAEARSTSKSAVSRRFVAATETALAELMSADLSGLDLVAVMVDGVHFAGHCCVVALGIGIDGTKHPLAVVEGSTENATLVADLLVGLRSGAWSDPAGPGRHRRRQSAALGGSRAVFDHPIIQRCQLQKPETSRTSCPNGWPRRWPRRCGLPTATPTRCRRRGRHSRPSPANWNAPTGRPPPACGRASKRPSPSAVSACRRRWLVRCVPPTPSSR